MLFWLIAAGTFILDQLTKWFVQVRMEPGESVPLIENIFHLTYVENRGAAFGILANQTTFFVVITLVVLVAIIIFYKRVPNGKKLLRAGLALEVGGALGNLTDRLAYGHVVDFFDLRFWPVFNVADTAIVVGVGFILWEIIKEEKASGGDNCDAC